MFKWLRKNVKKAGVSTETASTGMKSQGDMIRQVMGSGDGITHEKLNALSTLYLGVTIQKSLYRLRNTKIYGVVLCIDGVWLDICEEKGLKDVKIRFIEVGLCSSMVLELSIKEVAEFLEPIEDIVVSVSKEKTP